MTDGSTEGRPVPPEYRISRRVVAGVLLAAALALSLAVLAGGAPQWIVHGGAELWRAARGLLR